MKTFHQLRLRFTGIATLALLSTFAFSDQEELNPNTPQSAVNLPPGAPPLPPDTDIGTSDQAGQETSIDEEGNSTGNDGDSYPPSELREQGYDNSDSDPNHDTSGDGDCESPRPRPQPPYNDPYPPDVPDPESPPYDDPGECFHHVFRLHGPGNLSSGFVRFFTYDFENPGMDGLTYNLPANFEIITKPIPRPNEPTIFFPGIEAVDTGAGTISFGPAPQNMLAIDPNAFVAKEKTAGGYEFRTTMIYFINEGGIDRLRMDVTEHGKLLRYEQTNPEPNKLVTSIGPVENDNFTPLRRSTLTKNHDNPDRRIERKIFEEWSVEASGFVVVADHETWREAYMTPKAAARLNLSSVRPSPPDRGGEGSERAHVSGPGLRVPVGQDSNGRSFNVVTPGHRWRVIRQIINPDGPKPLTNDWTYYDAKDVTASGASRQSIGRVKSYRMYDGRQATYTYGLNTYTVKTPYADDPEGLVTTSTWNPGTRTRTLTRSVNGQEISRVVLTYTNTRLTHTRYTSATETLTTIIDYKPDGQLFGGFPTRVVHSDGTLTTYDYEREDTGGITTTTENGSTDNNATNVIEGLRTIVTTNSRGHTIYRETQAIGFDDADGKIYERMAVTEIDARGRPEVTLWHPATLTYVGEVAIASDEKWRTSTVQFCCGPYSVTDRNGITTTYAYDGLKRRIKSNRLGVTTETHYLGLTTETHRYPETVVASLSPELTGTSTSLVGRSIRNLSGTEQESWSPNPASTDPEDLVATTSETTYAPAAGLSRRTTTTVPGGHQQVTDSFVDGRTASTSGALSPAMVYHYSVNAIGELTAQAYIDGSEHREITATQTDRAGRTVKSGHLSSLLSSVFESSVSMHYNNKGQLVRTVDPDGVVTHMVYNTKGERTTTATDLQPNVSYNNQIDNIAYGIDTVQFSETVPAVSGGNPVWLTTSKVWQNATQQNPDGIETVVSTSIRSIDGLSASSTTLGVANPSTRITTLLGNGNWTTTQTNPDNTFGITNHVDGRMVSSAMFAAGADPEEDDPIVSTSQIYDAWNRPTQTTDSRTGTTVTAYMSATNDAVASVTDPGNRTTAFTYDIRGRQIKTILPDLTEIITAYTARGEVESRSGSQTYPVTYTYDYAGRQKTMTTYGTVQATTTWHYSSTRGWLDRKEYPGGKETQYDYTDAGRLLSRTWARTPGGQPLATGYSYDAGGRLVGTAHTDNITPAISITYDALSRKTSESSLLSSVLQSSVSYTYDPTTLRLESETHNLGGVTRTITRTYDALGRPDVVSAGIDTDNVPTTLETLEHSTAYIFGSDSRLLGIDAKDIPQLTGKNHGIEYTYTTNSGGLIHSITRAGAGTSADLITTHDWDSTRNVLLEKENRLDGAADPVSMFTYTVNAIGQRDKVETAGTAFGSTDRGWTWGYDDFGQVSAATHADDTDLNRSYEYDAIGNRLFSEISNNAISNPAGPNTTAYTPNALNQYSQISNNSISNNPTHDFDGNLTEDAAVNKDSEDRQYLWDAENRLIAVNHVTARDGNGAITATSPLVTYTHDSNSRRISRTDEVASATTWYLYDGWNVIAEYEGASPVLTRTYTWGTDLSGSMQGAGGVGGLLAVRLHGGANQGNYYPTFDGNGNVSEYLTDSGVKSAHYEYDPFGNDITPISAAGSLQSQFTYRFSTKPLDEMSGWYYYGYRWYDPYTGRWPSRDPIEEEGGSNLYGFLYNNPIRNIDFLGLVNIPALAWDSEPQWRDSEMNVITGSNKTHFLWRLNECTLTVFLPIRFATTGMKQELGTNYDAQAELRRKLKLHHEDPESPYAIMNNDIHRAWNDRFKFCCYCACEEGINIQIKIGPGDNYVRDQRANIGLFNIPGQRRGVNQLYWNIGLPNMAAHEIGHWLGNPDEYPVDGPRLFPERNADNGFDWIDYSVSDTESIMVGENGQARARHFTYISKRFREGKCKIVAQGQPCPEQE